MKALLLIVALWFSVFTHAEVSVGEIPPQDLGINRSGEKVSLSNMRGKVVVVTFWASWCPPCLKELPILERIQRHVGKDQLEVVAVNFREDKTVFNRVKRNWKEIQITVTYDRRSVASKKYGVKAIPHMFMIDKEGKVASMHVGYEEDQLPELVEELNQLLSRS